MTPKDSFEHGESYFKLSRFSIKDGEIEKRVINDWVCALSAMGRFDVNNDELLSAQKYLKCLILKLKVVAKRFSVCGKCKVPSDIMIEVAADIGTLAFLVGTSLDYQNRLLLKGIEAELLDYMQLAAAN